MRGLRAKKCIGSPRCLMKPRLTANVSEVKLGICRFACASGESLGEKGLTVRGLVKGKLHAATSRSGWGLAKDG